MKKSLLKLSLLGAFAMSSFSLSAETAQEPMAAYLFSYFTGNSPQQEQICYAISFDGFNYTPMNNGNPVIASSEIALTGCVRDPHILRGEDGYFYMVATDMKSSLGWQSNHGLVLLRSTDLINWDHHAIDFQVIYPGTKYANSKYVWAPQTIWDEEAGKYMIYFAWGDGEDKGTGTVAHQIPSYVYANADFSDLEKDADGKYVEPKVLFDRGEAAIDMDIVLDDNDIYHCFYKDEATAHGVTQCTFAKGDLHDSSKWNFDYPKISYDEAAEGCGVFRLLDGGWCLMWDCYNNGHYSFNKSNDLFSFTFVQNTETKGAFTPRHGTVIQITKSELEALEAVYPYVVNVEGLPTGASYIMQAGSGLHLGKNDDGKAVVLDNSDTQTLVLVPSTSSFGGFYNIALAPAEGEAPTEFLEKYGNDNWTTVFRAGDTDKDFALWSVEDAGDGYVKFKNKQTGAYLGSDNATAGSSVYSDKSGSNIKHKFYFAEIETPKEDDPSAGINAVEMGNGNAEYFSLDGIRLSAPRQGINIKRCNGKVEKVYVK